MLLFGVEFFGELFTFLLERFLLFRLTMRCCSFSLPSRYNRRSFHSVRNVLEEAWNMRATIYKSDSFLKNYSQALLRRDSTKNQRRRSNTNENNGRLKVRGRMRDMLCFF